MLHYLSCILTIQSLVVTECTIKFSIKTFYVLHTQCIYVFCVVLRDKRQLFSYTGSYNRAGVCLLCS